MKTRRVVLEIRDKERRQGEPLAWLLVERTETYRCAGTEDTPERASIQLSYERIKTSGLSDGRDYGEFCGGYSRQTNTVSLTSATMSRGTVFLDGTGLQGQRIGTYLMNEIVQWAKQWPEATVEPIQLLPQQAWDENKARRNRFYERFGLVFDYTDSQHTAGASRPMPVSALNPVNTWKQNITETALLDFLGEVLWRQRRASEDSEALKQQRAYLLRELHRAESRPLRWALSKSRRLLLIGTAVVIVAVPVWLSVT